MALKDSLDKVKASRDKLKSDIESTRKTVQELRPKPFRNAIDRRMTELRPLKRMRKHLSQIGMGNPVGEDST